MNRNSTRYHSNKQEKRVAKTLGGRVVGGSGSGDFQKGDVKLPDLFIECKTNIEPRKSMTFQREWFTKAREQAWQMGKPFYAVAFSFGDGEDFVAVPSSLFNELYEAFKKGENQ